MHSEFEFHGLTEANDAMDQVIHHTPHAMVAVLSEAGLFGERETKLRTRVDTGRARASIGHFTPSDLTSKADSKTAKEAQDGAYYEDPTPQKLEVSWGSRVVYIPVLNYKLGDLMFEHGLQATVSYMPILCAHYLGELFTPLAGR